MRTILIVDGISPRGLAVIRYLSSTGDYHILVFTKDTTSAGVKSASSLPSVTLLLNRANSGYDLQTFAAAAQRCPSILICSHAANSEGREGVQWGARLMQSAATAGAQHVVFLSMERERKQYSTDNFIHSQSKAPLAWTIIRSPTTDASSLQSSSSGSERSLSPAQLRNLAYYVSWVFSNPDRSSGLDFVLPVAEPSGANSSRESKRRDSKMESAASPAAQSHRVEGIHPHPASQTANSSSAARPTASRTGSSGAVYMDAGRAEAIQQWVAKTTPDSKKESDDGEEDSDEDRDSSGSDSD